MKLEEDIDSDLAKEIITILPYLEEEYQNIPSDFLSKLLDLAAESTKDFAIKKDKKLWEQDLSEDCKNFLSFLYYQFADKKEKEELLNIWADNATKDN